MRNRWFTCIWHKEELMAPRIEKDRSMAKKCFTPGDGGGGC